MHKRLKTALSSFLASMLIISSFCSVGSVSAAAAPVTLKFAREYVSIDIGEEIYMPAECTDNSVKITYKVKYENVASMDGEGNIVGLRLGSTPVTATGSNGMTATLVVSVGCYNGIDVSTHNKKVDWTAIANAGIDFAFIRTGYGKDDKYIDKQMDEQLINNLNGAVFAGIDYGFYYYAYALNEQQARTEAAHCLEYLRRAGEYAAPQCTALPVAYDIEESSQAALGKTTLTNMVIAFCDVIKAAGYMPMLYCNQNYCTNYIDIKRLQDLGIDIWLAHYDKTKEYKKIAAIDSLPSVWQYDSNGIVSGNGTDRIDVNLAEYGLYAKYRQRDICEMTMYLPEGSYPYTGTQICPELTVLNAKTGVALRKDFDYRVAYDENTEIGTGRVMVNGIGRYNSGRTIEFSIVQADINNMDIRVSDAVLSDGNAIPRIEVSNVCGELAQNFEYTVSFTDNNGAGKGTVVITGGGKYYYGTAVRNFKIIDGNIETYLIKVAPAYYTGSAVKPEITVQSDDATLTNGVEYTVTYTNAVKVGTGTVTVKGKSPFTGEVKLSYDVKPVAVTGVTATPVDTKSIKVTWKKVSGASGYEIYDTKLKKKVKSVSSSTLSATLGNLSVGSTHVYKVRAYITVDGKKYYGAYSSQVTTSTLLNKSTVKTLTSGSKKKLTVTYSLKQGATGYQIQYSQNKSFPDSYKVNVTGGDTLKKTFSVNYSGKTYYVRVRAVKKLDGKTYYGAWSAVKSVKSK